jgi:serine/threonine protein kinase
VLFKFNVTQHKLIALVCVLPAMDKYHIYEEIGKGEFSQVFKGREKKKIEYVAIKRIEKSIMNKVRFSCNHWDTNLTNKRTCLI